MSNFDLLRGEILEQTLVCTSGRATFKKTSLYHPALSKPEQIAGACVNIVRDYRVAVIFKICMCFVRPNLSRAVCQHLRAIAKELANKVGDQHRNRTPEYYYDIKVASLTALYVNLGFMAGLIRISKFLHSIDVESKDDCTYSIKTNIHMFVRSCISIMRYQSKATRSVVGYGSYRILAIMLRVSLVYRRLLHRKLSKTSK